MKYTDKIIKHCIDNYYEIEPSNLLLQGFENAVCVLSDIDNAVNIALSHKERELISVVKMVGEKEASSFLKITRSSMKYQISNICKKISNHLNGVA